MKNHIVFLLALMIMLSGCAVQTESVEYQKISPQRALEIMVADAVILDVRTKEEYDEGHIPNSILIPYDEIQDKAETLLPDKSQTILIYCRSGRRSEIAAHTLIKMGYTSVYDFGGIINWPGEIVKTDT